VQQFNILRSRIKVFNPKSRFKIIHFLGFALAITLFFGAAKSPSKSPVFSSDMILGNWMDEKNEVLVNIYKVNNKYFGKTLWIQNLSHPGQPLVKEEQHWIGMMVMSEFVWQNYVWTNGTIFQPRENQTYSAYITPINQNNIKVTGFVWFRFLSQSAVFHRTTRKR